MYEGSLWYFVSFLNILAGCLIIYFCLLFIKNKSMKNKKAKSSFKIWEKKNTVFFSIDFGVEFCLTFGIWFVNMTIAPS